MHIVVDATAVSLGGGITVIRQLLPAFVAGDGGAHRYTVVCRGDVRLKLGFVGPRVAFVRSDRLGRSFPARLIAEQLDLPLRAALDRADVILCPSNQAVWAATVPQVVMFQNVAPYTPSVVESYRGTIRRRLKVLREVGIHSARRAQRVVFVSKAQAATILPWLDIPSAKTDVVYTGWDQSFSPSTKSAAAAVLKRHGLGGRYLLSVSQFYRYKNLVELVRGFALALPSLPADVQLVFTGSEPEPDYSAEVRAAVREAGLGARIRFLGHVPDGELPPLYSAATLFLFSSTCESFPNILLEALASGVPVISSDRCSMPEIAGDAAVYFDPFKPDEIAARIAEVWANPERREELGRAGVQRSRSFSWDAMAVELLKILTEAHAG